MKNRFRRLLRHLPTVSLAAASLFVCAGEARAQGAGSRTQGPVSGPVIVLPPSQGGAAAEHSEPSERRRESAAARGRRTKWEYCVIEHVSTTRKDSFSNFTGIAYIRYFRGGREPVEGAHEEEALANAINRLGEEGWEMFAIREAVGLTEGTGQSVPKYFFKRPM